MACWPWIEKALTNNLEKAGITDKAVSDPRPDSGENEPDSRNSSASENQTRHSPWMSVSVKTFRPLCSHLCILSQVVSAHKWIRLNRMKIFTSFSFSNMPLCPSEHTPEIFIPSLQSQPESLLLSSAHIYLPCEQKAMEFISELIQRGR